MTKLYRDFLQEYSAIAEKDRRSFLYEYFRPKKHLHLFGRFVFPHIIKGNYETPECHIDLIRELSSPVDSGIIFPRGFAKSTWEKIDTLHDIVYGIEPVILYIGNTIQDAKFHFESIKTELENNAILQYIYGDLTPSPALLSRKWTNTHFETTNGVNCVARGAGKGRGVNIKNRRPTKIILDDIEDDEQVASPERRLKLHNWIFQVVFNSRDKERGKMKFIGTVISPMAEVLKFYRSYGGIFRKAIEKGESIWSEYFTLGWLYRIRDGYTNKEGDFVPGIGTRAFSQEYLNTPINDELSMIKAEWLEKSTFSTLSPTFLKHIIMMDPQSGEKESADSYGVCVLGQYPKDRHRYIIEIQSGKGSQLQQAAILIRTWMRYRETCSIVGVEKVLGQVAVYQLILEWKAGGNPFDEEKFPDLFNCKNRNIPLKGVEPRGKDGGVVKSKVARLEKHEPSFERGEIHIHQALRSFMEKLTAFPEVEHDDDIDSMIYCLDYSYKSGLSIDGKPSYNRRNKESLVIVGDIMKKTF